VKEIDDLRHALMMRFGLPSGRPTEDELVLIVGDVLALRRVPTDDDWRESVKRRIPVDFDALRRGQDFSDLNALFALLLQAAKKER
jgi:hypothetical protein